MRHILLVDDDDNDAMLVRRVISRVGLEATLEVVNDGQSALDYLRGVDDFAYRVLPDIVLLDLNMPGMNGHDVLKAIKQDEHLRTIPVLVFTTSDDDKDVLEAYANHANTYIQKPDDLADLMRVFEEIRDYWIDTARLPRT